MSDEASAPEGGFTDEGAAELAAYLARQDTLEFAAVPQLGSVGDNAFGTDDGAAGWSNQVVFLIGADVASLFAGGEILFEGNIGSMGDASGGSSLATQGDFSIFYF